MQPWNRWREPLAVVLLVVLALVLVLRVWFVVLATADENSLTFFGSPSGGDNLLLLAAALAVLWCVTPLPVTAPSSQTFGATSATAEGLDSTSVHPVSPATADARAARELDEMSPHAWPIAVAGLVIVGLTVLGWLIVSGLNLNKLASWPTPDLGYLLQILDGLLQLAIPVVSLVAVVLAVRRADARRRAAAGEGLPALPPAASAGETSGIPEVSVAPERLPAAWQADEATGAVWLTADDAAEGRPGLSWAQPSPSGSPVADQPWASPPSSGPPDGMAAESPTTAVPGPDAAQDDDLR